MWISLSVIVGVPVSLIIYWLLKIWLIDIPAQDRDAAARAKIEKREIAEIHAGWRQGDRILEDIVTEGAPQELLAVRRFSDKKIVRQNEISMSSAEKLRSYERFHEAMNLYEKE